MLDKLKVKINEELKSFNIFVDNIKYEKKGKNEFLNIILDKDGGLDLDLVVKASKIINKLIDKEDLPYENYVLDISSKERGAKWTEKK